MKIKEEKGITLVTLVVAVSILILLSSMLIYNAKDSIKMRNLKMMQNDIEILDDKIDAYYIKYGALPISILYSGAINFEPQANDSEEYYVIDLSALEGITLNYGLDFNNIETEKDITNLTDLYIINTESHHIYYPKGIKYDGEIYYTIDQDDEVIMQEVSKLELLRISEETVDENTTLEDKNGDKITIPKGFNIDKESPIIVTEGIVIEDSEENQYVWIPVFEKNAKRDWGVDYSAVVTAKTAEKIDFTTDDYTAIQTALKAYTNIYKTIDFSDVWYGDANYGQYGYYNGEEFIYYTNGNMSEDEYTDLYNNMLVSVYKNGGFYIGRYEMGIGVADSVEKAQSLTRTSMTEYTASKDTNTSTTVRTDAEPSIEGMPTPVSKANAVGYTYITQSQAQMLAEKMEEEYGYGNTTSSLMFGVQWDAVCVFLENYGKLSDGTKFDSSYLAANTNGKLWGNYKNSTFTMDRGYYNLYDISKYNLTTWNEKNNVNKDGSNNECWLCTTGASDQNSALNIYDFGGNLYEFTLERSSNSSNPVILRGGYFSINYYAWRRDYLHTCNSVYLYSARTTLCL